MPPIQLISPLWGPLATQQAAQALSDSNTDFLVVGVCSAEGVAGPALVHALAGRVPTPSAAEQRQLPGLQMHVSPRERTVTLDACGMLSPGLLTALVSSNRPQPAVSSTAAAAVRAAARKAGTGSSSVPVEGVALLLTLQLLVFLSAVCNVLVVSSELIDLQLLQLLEAAGIVAASLPTSITSQHQQQMGPAKAGAPATGAAAAAGGKQAARGRQQRAPAPSPAPAPAASQDKRVGSKQQGPNQQQQQQPKPMAAEAAASAPASHIADLVLLQCSQHSSPSSLQQVQQVVQSCLASTAWGSRHQPLLQHPAAASSQSGVGLWTAAATCASSPPRVPAELQQLVSRLLHYPRTAPSTSSSSSRGGPFSRSMTEGEWLRGAERVYDAVQDSLVLLQYYRAAAEARLVGAGGWGAPGADVMQQVVGSGDGW